MPPIDALLIAEMLALGCATGFLAGLLGIGGGMLMVPFITAVVSQRGVAPALAVKMGIATSMATILLTSLASVRAHQRRGAVRWDLVATLAPGIVVMGLVTGAFIFPLVRGALLLVLFAVFIGYSATQMLLDRKPPPGRRLPGTAGRSAMGGVIGMLSGLVGVGGAFVSVPFMTRCNVPIHNAIATSAALGFPIALASTAGNLIGGWSLPQALPGAFGYLYLPALAAIVAASVLTAPFGARAAHALDVRRLKRAFALLLYVLAGYMLWKGLAG